jgi:hypothetical protein
MSIPPTPKQAELLAWIANLGAADAVAVGTHQECGVAEARARLAAAKRAGMLERHALLRGQPALYVPTRAGLRACGARRSLAARITAANAAHAATCARVAAWLERAFPGHEVVGEPVLRQARPDSGLDLSCTLPSYGSARGHRGHRGDLAVLDRRGGAAPVVVEVELTVKAPERLEQICRGWARCRSVAGVVYVAAPAVEQPVRRAVERAGAGDRVAVVPLAAVPLIRAGAHGR